MYNNRFNQLKELATQIYEEMYAIEQIKGFENPEVWKPEFFMHYVLDTLRGSLMKNTYNISWEESAEVYTWLKTLSFGPPKPPVVHKPLATTFRFADIISGHTIYDENHNIVRYIDGHGNWVERTPNGDFVIVT